MKTLLYPKIIILFTLLLLLCCSFGCSQKGSAVAFQDVVIEDDEVPVDKMDMLLNDDFFDEEKVVEQIYYDPLEPMNRVFFEFNDKLYYWFLSPLNTAYTAILPWDIRFSIGNFVNNLAAPIRLVNNLLQLKIKDAGVEISRFLINSTLGVFGFGDPAMLDFGLAPREEDFGQTLGYWGVGEGVYLCVPIIGPSNVRDLVGFTADAYTHPMVYYIDELYVSAGYYAGSRVNLLSLNPEVYEDLKKYSLDPYVSMRQVYLEYRRKKIDDNPMQRRSDNEL
ncbi:surface lipoprotein [Desulfocapsa sulfexigens DSM 10523]|uniref:Surface lipoprotein n=1 Tax=Desulfocapsa sulfexigens (strain DSM 10523 / SB164P1) TaxID=1167006 RepID=M1PHL7_DESSD|nr:surface lipoprotein [Desulfocapsa sulfexigens DSM 10523]